MEEVSISRFKATCLAVLENVRRTRRRIRVVTRFGTPVAEIVPPSADQCPAFWLGSMKGTGRIVGDIVAPPTALRNWDVSK